MLKVKSFNCLIICQKETVMKKNQKASLGERICNALDLSPGVLPKTSLIEIHGRSLVKIQNAGKILLYTDVEIKISLRSSADAVCVRGSNLRCSSYNMGAVGIHGKIKSVDFRSEDENEKQS